MLFYTYIFTIYIIFDSLLAMFPDFFFLLTFVATLLSGPPFAHAWPATVISVTDGDTVRVAPCGDTSTPMTVRLYGIDAPEFGQDGGEESKRALEDFLPAETAIEVIPQGMDKYERTLGLVMSGGRCINGQMIRDGQAWHYLKYCRAAMCKGWKRMQQAAQRERRGLWREGKPVAPWEWRKGKG